MKKKKDLSFIQIPTNLPRLFEILRDDKLIFVPIEDIIRTFINKLFRNIDIESVDLFRLIETGISHLMKVMISRQISWKNCAENSRPEKLAG
jgi:polyphosphate kinase